MTRRPPLIFALWGGWLIALAAGGMVVFGLDGPEAPLLLGGAGGVAITLSVLALAAGGGRREQPGLRAEPDLSPPTVLGGVALGSLALGAQLGLWLILISGGMLVAAAGGVVRERLAQRRSLEAERRR